MKKLKLGLFISTILGTLGGLVFSIYYISATKREDKNIKVKGVFSTNFLANFKTYFRKKNVGLEKENIYFSYENPSNNKSLKYNENKLFNIGSQSEAFLAFTTIRLIQDTINQDDETKKITLNDKLSKWYKIDSSNEINKEIANILNGDKLKIINESSSSYNFLTDVSILNLLTNSSDLPNFNNLKKVIPVTNEIRKKYQKQKIKLNLDGTFRNFENLNNSRFKLIDFMRLASSDLIDKKENNVEVNYFNRDNLNYLSSGYGPWKKNNNFWNLKNHSPLNFIILGDIIEKIYKNFKGITKTFDEIIREYIFEPLKMNNTYYNIEKIDKLKGKSYKEISTSFLNANSGFVSNLEDLTKFYKAIHNKSSLLLPSKSFNGQDDPYEGWYKLTKIPSKYLNYKLNWKGPGATKLYFSINNNIVFSHYEENIYFNVGISNDFRSWSFFSKEKDFFLMVASDVPYSFYSNNKNLQTNSNSLVKTPTQITGFIESTFLSEIWTLLTKIK